MNRYTAWNAFVGAFWCAFWLLTIAATWLWLVVLPGIGALWMFGVLR